MSHFHLVKSQQVKEVIANGDEKLNRLIDSTSFAAITYQKSLKWVDDS